MDNAIDDLQDTFNIHSIAEVEQLQAEHEEFKANALQEANGRYEELNGYVQQMADMGSTDNPYTTLTPNVSNMVKCVCGNFITIYCQLLLARTALNHEQLVHTWLAQITK